MKKLSHTLLTCSEEQLEQMAHLWAIGDPPSGGWKDHQGVLLLIERMQQTIAARFVWERLSPDERQLLYRILTLSASSGLLRSVLLKLSQLPAPRFETAVNTLERYSLLIEEQGQATFRSSSAAKKNIALAGEPLLSVPIEISQVLLTTGHEFFRPDYDRSEMTLDRILSQLNQVDLYEIARIYGIRMDTYYTHFDPRAKITGSLVQPELAFYALEQLDAPTLKLCRWLLDQGGKASLQEVRDYTGLHDPALATTLRTLERCAVAFDTFSGQKRVLFVSRSMLKNLKKAAAQLEVIPEEAPIGLVTLDAPPPAIRSADTLLVYDLAVAIGSVYQQDIEPTKSGTVPKRIAAKILPLLHIQPRIQYYDEGNLSLEMLFRLAHDLELLQLSSSPLPDIKEHYEPGLQLAHWSNMERGEQTLRLFEHWLTDHHWVDKPGVHYTDNHSYYLDHLAARNVIVSHLQTCMPGRWYSLASLLSTIKGEDPFVLRPRLYSGGFPGYRNAREVRSKWASCDGEIITGVLSSSLYELGIVSLGYSQPDTLQSQQPLNPDAFLLTEFGARILALAAKPNVGARFIAPAPGTSETTLVTGDTRSLVVQPNFELLLLHPDIPTLYSLLPFAQIQSVGLVSRLTLTRHSVLRGMGAGKGIEHILHFLQEHSQKGLPQNVEYTLRDWTRLYKEATISQVFLLEVTSESLANELCLSPRLQALGLRRLGATAISARSDIGLQELRRALEKEGFVVRITGSVTSPRDNRMLIYGRLR